MMIIIIIINTNIIFDKIVCYFFGVRRSRKGGRGEEGRELI